MKNKKLKIKQLNKEVIVIDLELQKHIKGGTDFSGSYSSGFGQGNF